MDLICLYDCMLNSLHILAFSLRANPLARSPEQENCIRTRERICLDTIDIFLNLAFGEVGEKN